MNRFIALCGIALLTAAVLLADGDESKYQVDFWTTENGLPDNYIKAIRQTRDGYIWLTTEAGLVRFDGLRFRVFSTANTPPLKTNRYTSFALLEDSRGALWAGTLRNGAVRYHNGVFTTFDTSNGLPDNGVTRIDEDGRGAVWIHTEQGIARFDNGIMAPVQLEMPHPTAATPERTSLAPALGEDRVYAGKWLLDNTGLWRFAYGKWQRVPPIPGAMDPAKLRLARLLDDSRANLWFSVRGQPAPYYSLDRDGNLRTYRDTGPRPGAIIRFEDSRGRRVIWNLDGHVGIWDKGNYHPIDGLKTLSVIKVLEDREGQLWIATKEEGLVRVKERVMTFNRPPGGPAHNAGHALLRDTDGTFWFGTQSGLFHLARGAFRAYLRPGFRPDEMGNVIRALHQDGDGTLWVGTSAGLTRLRNGVLTTEPILEHPRTMVEAIHRDRKGNLWVGTKSALLRARGGGPLENAGFKGATVHTILEDRNGGLWFGTESGLTRFTGDGFVSYTVADSMAPGQLVALVEDSKGVLWAGMGESGLVRITFDGANARFTRITENNGLFSNTIYDILDDDSGSFWITSRQGIYRVRRQELDDFANGKRAFVNSIRFGPEELSPLRFGVPQGSPRALRAPDGRLWFATLRGIASFHPGQLRENKSAPVAEVEECLLDRRPVHCRDGLRLGPGAPDLELRYTALNFLRPAQVQFRYQLEGFDSSWIEAGTRRTAYYPRLPPGNYHFHVEAGNSEGVWGQQTATLPITVLPAFYQTWWFLSLAAIAAAAAIYAAHSRRIARLRHANATQERFARQLIETQEMERKRIAAELHDSLGQSLLIIRNQAVLGGMGEPARNGAQFAAIVDTAAQTLEEVRQIAADLRPHHLDRLGLTQALEAMVEKAASVTEIVFLTEIDDVDGAFAKEAEITVFRVLQESISNILKHSEATQARVRVIRQPDTVHVTITDNGRGFAPRPAAEELGFGLTGMAERVRILGGQYTVESAPGNGTSIHIQLRSNGASHGH